jgi:hypothetical protein
VFQARKFWGGRIVTKFFEKLNKFIKGQYKWTNENNFPEPELLNIGKLKWQILRLKLLNNLLEYKDKFPQILKRVF